MLDLPYDYETCIKNSEKVAWKLDDVLPVETRLNFARPFLPEVLAPTRGISCLDDAAKLKLNQIAGNAYLNLFAFVEEYILATMVQHQQAELFGDHQAVRALARFTEEEVKHQLLFHRYRKAFDRDFGHACGVLDSAAAVAGVIMGKSPIAVMLVTLHIEIMTQDHYPGSVRDSAIDPLFAKLLKMHWLEEAQHARIDALELDKLLDTAAPAQIAQAFDDYLDLIGAFDGLLATQAKLDVASLEGALGRKFTEVEAAEIVASQHRGYRQTFLVSGMEAPQFEQTMKKISTEAAARIAQRSKELH
jgi:hypothetical protein